METYSQKAPPTFATTAYLQPYCHSKEQSSFRAGCLAGKIALLTSEDGAARPKL